MRELRLAGERSFENENRQRTSLFYYLVEDHRDMVVDTPLYGIQVQKQVKENGKIVKEKETAVAISYSEDFVKQLLYDLIHNMVTPMCLLEVLDDLVTKEINYSA